MQAQSKPYFERAFATPGKIAPDLLAEVGQEGDGRPVSDKMTLSDGTRTVELHRIAGRRHTDTFLMVYLPKERLLIEADAYTPRRAERAAAGDAEREQRRT